MCTQTPHANRVMSTSTPTPQPYTQTGQASIGHFASFHLERDQKEQIQESQAYPQGKGSAYNHNMNFESHMFDHHQQNMLHISNRHISTTPPHHQQSNTISSLWWSAMLFDTQDRKPGAVFPGTTHYLERPGSSIPQPPPKRSRRPHLHTHYLPHPPLLD